MIENTIEKAVASTILERKTGSIEIEGKVYDIASPSIATLIMVSEIVSMLPIVQKTDDDKIVYQALHYAKDFKALGDIAAVLILGAKGIKEDREEIIVKRYLGGLYRKKTTNKKTVNIKDELAQAILDNVRPSTLFSLIIQRLKDMEISSFFAITTSLSEVNIIKPTKEVVH